ncbi:MAG: hypothetical protein ACREEM_34685 [Blastocatellia bacterium]
MHKFLPEKGVCRPVTLCSERGLYIRQAVEANTKYRNVVTHDEKIEENGSDGRNREQGEIGGRLMGND